MHPIEQLRYVARATGADAGMLAAESASAISAFADDPGAVLTTCRRLLTRQPDVGLLWWLSGRLAHATDVRSEARTVIDELRTDPTARELAASLPDDATVVVMGWPDLVASALPRRGDLEVLIIDGDGRGQGLARRLERSDVPVEVLEPMQLGAAVEMADVVLLEASAVGEHGVITEAGGLMLAATSQLTRTPLWLVAGVGRALPEPYVQAIVERCTDAELPFLRSFDFLGAAAIDRVVRPEGLLDAGAWPTPDAPLAPELLRSLA